MISFSIPGQPRGKQRPRIGKVAGDAVAFTPQQTRTEEGAVRMFAAAAMAGRPPLEGPLEFHVKAYMPIPVSWSAKKQTAARKNSIFPIGKPDADNCGKLVADGLNHIVWRDDSQIVRFVVEKFYSDTPRVDVIITPLATP